jgi:ketose-bisphosphate aldolase
MRAVAEAAEELRAPVILMATSLTLGLLGIGETAHAFRGVAEARRIPCALHMDHGKDYKKIMACIENGFTSVMIDASEKSLDENIALTRQVVRAAHARGVSVEAELGTVAGKEDDLIHEHTACVKPENIQRFVAETEVDALAIGFGTVHGLYQKEANLRYDLITEAAALTDVPLVMHGGTGLSKTQFKRAIQCGIAKVNIGTEIKHAFARALFNAAHEEGPQSDPRVHLRAVYDAVKTTAVRHIQLFGGEGRGA